MTYNFLQFEEDWTSESVFRTPQFLNLERNVVNQIYCHAYCLLQFIVELEIYCYIPIANSISNSNGSSESVIAVSHDAVRYLLSLLIETDTVPVKTGAVTSRIHFTLFKKWSTEMNTYTFFNENYSRGAILVITTIPECFLCLLWWWFWWLNKIQNWGVADLPEVWS